MPKRYVVHDPHHPGPAPPQFAGEWVAWDSAQTKIVAHGRDIASVHAAAVAAGHSDAVLEKVRRPGTVFIGAS